METPNINMSKSAAWVSSLKYADINNWDIETYRTFLCINPKLQKLLVRPKDIKISQVKSLIATNLHKAILYNKRCNNGITPARDFDQLVINTLNMEIKMIQQIFDLKLDPIYLGKTDDFHNDIKDLYEKIAHFESSIRQEREKESNKIAVLVKGEGHPLWSRVRYTAPK